MIEIHVPIYTRRAFLKSLTVGALTFPALRVFGEETLRFVESGSYLDELVRTPSQTEGPFYPDKLPLDVDNDLILISPSTTPAVGSITRLSGRVLDLHGEPIKGVTVEIWQVDSHGVYIHSGSGNKQNADRNFQGFGRFETDSKGAYAFRTVKPVPYPGRTPHIHVKVKKGDRELLCTQCFVKGEPQNERDGVLQSIQDAKQRASVIVPFVPIAGSKIGELSAQWDIVLGYTPAE